MIDDEPKPPTQYVWLVTLEASERMYKVFALRTAAEQYISSTLTQNPNTRFMVGLVRLQVNA